MSNHRDSFPEEADEIRFRLEALGFEVIEMLFDVPNPNRDFNWAYINYLQVGNKIIVPTQRVIPVCSWRSKGSQGESPRLAGRKA